MIKNNIGENLLRYSLDNQSLAFDGRLRKDRKTKSCALGTLSKELGIQVYGDNWHSGLYDVKVTWEVFKKLVWGMEVQDVWK